MLPNNLILPGPHDQTKDVRSRIHIYLDTSGSCIADAKYFLANAITLPPDLFDVRIFGFHVHVYELEPSPPYHLRGFGGTAFDPIIHHVEEETDGVLDAVFIFTDGDAALCKRTISNPRSWFWFITPDGTSASIPTKCHHINLAKYDWRS